MNSNLKVPQWQTTGLRHGEVKLVWTKVPFFHLSGEDAGHGGWSGGAARQRTEMGRQTQESHWPGSSQASTTAQPTLTSAARSGASSVELMAFFLFLLLYRLSSCRWSWSRRKIWMTIWRLKRPPWRDKYTSTSFERIIFVTERNNNSEDVI